MIGKVFAMATLGLLLVTTSSGCTKDVRYGIEPSVSPWLVELGRAGTVSMARVELPATGTFRFSASTCQEVMVLVERGTARASLTWLEAGDAARFHAPTVVQAMSDDGVSLFAVAVVTGRAGGEGDAEPDWATAATEPSCGPLVTAVEVSNPATTGPFVRAGGALQVKIHLDAPETTWASLGTLEGSPKLEVPEHIHERSAEVLWFESGSGTMLLGQRSIPIAPGTFVYVPRATVHGFIPDGTQPLSAYQVYTPSGPEQRFRQP